MKTNRLALLAVCGLFIFTDLPKCAAQSAPFTYQGRFIQSGAPYSGIVEMQFTLWNAASNGTLLASTTPAIQSLNVSNGLFTTTLDFGSAQFTGADRWLQIDARTTRDDHAS